MTKQEKRITELEKEVKELREQLLQLAMRPVQTVYIPYQAPATNPFQPLPYPLNPTITWGGSDAQATCGMISGSGVQSGSITYSVNDGPSFQNRQSN
jgi:hypothetical protein